MKKFILILLVLFTLTGCRKVDSIMFKNEYESLNNKDGYLDVNIPSDNPFIYITDEVLASKIENKEDLIVFFGFNKNPYVRSMIESLIQVSKDLNIDKIYYLDIYEIREEKKLNDQDEITITKKGTDSYYKLLELLNDYIDNYNINGNVYGKRINEPFILMIKDNNIIDGISGISENLTSSKQEVTSEIKKDSYNIIYNYLKKYNENVCNVNEGC